MLKIDKLTVTITAKSLVKDISFELNHGSYLCILGANGAGKSTLLKAMMGMIDISSGHIWLDDTDMLTLKQKQRARQLSYVSQLTKQNIDFKVEQFIKMARYPYHDSFSDWNHDDQQAFEQAITITDTEQFLARQLNTLSGGESQRVMIAAAVCQHTPILLLDEPTSFLDPYHQAEVQQLIQKLNKQHGMTIIEVTHDLNHAVHHAQNILALKNGQNLWYGKASELFESPMLEQVYDQGFVFTHHPQTGKKVALAVEHTH